MKTFTINHIITFTQNPNKSIKIETDWFTLNGEKTFDIRKKDLLHSLLHLKTKSNAYISIGNNSIPFFSYINESNLKVIAKYFHKLQGISKNPRILTNYSGIMYDSGIIKSYILPKIVNNELRYYVVGFSISINKKVVYEYTIDETSNNSPLFNDNFAIMTNMHSLVNYNNLVTNLPSFKIEVISKKKDYKHNIELFKRLFEQHKKLCYIDNYTQYSITNISFISNPNTGYSFLIECDSKSFIITEDEISVKIFYKGY